MFCAILMLITLTAWFKFDEQRIKNTIEVKKNEREQVKQAIDQSNALQQKLAIILDRKASLSKMQQQHPAYTLLLQDLARATPATLQLAGISLGRSASFTVDGTATDQTAVNDFVNKLNTASSFESATLNQATNLNGLVNFALTVALKGDKTEK